MDNICDKKLCTGCGACFAICPKGAITMVKNTKATYFKKYVF